MTYKFEFTSAQAQTLWACIQNAALPRAMTDELAEAFRRQIVEQNQAAEAEAKAKANGHDQASSQ